MENKESSWYELVERKAEFIEIIRVLQKDETQNSQNEASYEFRSQLVESPIEKITIFIKQFGNYEFLIKAKLGNRTEQWIHVDGIQQERDELMKDREVFHITSVCDLFRPLNCKEVPDLTTESVFS